MQIVTRNIRMIDKLVCKMNIHSVRTFSQVIYYSSYSYKTCFIAFCIISFLDNTNGKEKLNQDSAFLIDAFDTAIDLWLVIFHLGIKEYRKHIFPSHIFSKEKGCGKMR